MEAQLPLPPPPLATTVLSSCHCPTALYSCTSPALHFNKSPSIILALTNSATTPYQAVHSHKHHSHLTFPVRDLLSISNPPYPFHNHQFTNQATPPKSTPKSHHRALPNLPSPHQPVK
ncbi:hypothetical protein M0R45_036001 [Rubus argutus]|uniref:Uncharacterized protein n=1 Tax=Rubus argutus TaxID=59490 RepID=A0AAW1VZB6_RUBAR